LTLLGAQGIGEGAQRELGGRVGAAAGAGGEAGAGVDRHHRAAGLPQGGQQQAGEVGDGGDIGSEGAGPVRGGALLDAPARPRTSTPAEWTSPSSPWARSSAATCSATAGGSVRSAGKGRAEGSCAASSRRSARSRPPRIR